VASHAAWRSAEPAELANALECIEADLMRAVSSYIFAVRESWRSAAAAAAAAVPAALAVGGRHRPGTGLARIARRTQARIRRLSFIQRDHLDIRHAEEPEPWANAKAALLQM
jgi:hypothetical protein